MDNVKMSQDIELLLKDLSGRLPYGVKMNHIANNEQNPRTLIGIDRDYVSLQSTAGYSYVPAEDYKPYLFPLSSMTEEQKEELLYEYIHNDIDFDDFNDYFLAGELWHDICVSMFDLPDLLNWLNKNHFDYRGLIPKGLALDATGLNIYES